MLDIIFFAITVIWLLEFVFFRDRKPAGETNREKRSFYWIIGALVFTIALSVFSREVNLFLLPESLGLYVLGLIVYGAGVALRYWGIMKLGMMFSRDVAVESSVDLVSSGPYRILRHPLYTAILLCAIGIAIYLGSVLGLLSVIATVVPALLYRMVIEERMLVQELGNGYKSWCETRYRFIPYLY
ncbi:methyltransferase family protein [Alteribacter aurantiacus]|uniref:methyltransferase family protein n=1 Tax=Alteribacter aurantiacus TaxID=254410 RepID=UPI000413EB9F|nr:isoprenylcysteine carboxylmethyltransferase family protein [Alteribacter aurantiacus]